MASVKALEDSELIVIMNYSIIDLSKKHKNIYDKIINIISQRRSQNNS
jgi:CRP-like cAMP-binding protein